MIRRLIILSLLCTLGPTALLAWPQAVQAQGDCMESKALKDGQLPPASFAGRWEGTRGGKPVVLELQLSAQTPGVIVGQLLEVAELTVLVGEGDGLALDLDEIDAAQRPSGSWELSLCNRMLTGRWLDADDKNAQPVQLRRAPGW
jgi:hypothetical protein